LCGNTYLNAKNGPASQAKRALKKRVLPEKISTQKPTFGGVPVVQMSYEAQIRIRHVPIVQTQILKLPEIHIQSPFMRGEKNGAAGGPSGCFQFDYVAVVLPGWNFDHIVPPGWEPYGGSFSPPNGLLGVEIRQKVDFGRSNFSFFLSEKRAVFTPYFADSGDFVPTFGRCSHEKQHFAVFSEKNDRFFRFFRFFFQLFAYGRTSSTRKRREDYGRTLF
jgi:hypothetical protein